MSARECSNPRCRNTTTNASGYCHHHRAGLERRTFTPPPVSPPPPTPAPEQWEGVLHPTGGYDETDHTAHTRNYLRNGVSHREDGPAVIAHRGDGSVLTEEWARDGVTHREDGPAFIRYAPDGSVRDEEWSLHGRKHRVGGPAVTWRAQDGSVEQQWAVNGKVHRLDGPARVVVDRYRAVSETEFFIEGERVTAEAHALIREAVEGGAPYEWARSYATGATS